MRRSSSGAGVANMRRAREVGRRPLAQNTPHGCYERGQGAWLLAHADEIKPVIAMRGSGGLAEVAGL